MKVRPGGTANFQILVWTVEEKPFLIKAEVVDAPKDLVILVSPNETLLTNSPLGDVEVVNLPGKVVKALVIKIFAKVPSDRKEGKYNFSISLSAGNPGKGISMLQERKFRFTIEVEKVGILESIGKFISSGVGSITGMATKTAERPDLLLFVIVIIVISILIYKYS
jgi:hypothetical protein